MVGSKILNHFEDFEQKYKFSIRPEALALIFFVFWLIHRGRESFGDILPNPINIFNHIGNVDSVIPTLLVGLSVGVLCSRTLRVSKKRLLLIGIIAGTLAGLICNILVELPFGMDLLGEPNIADPLDVVWGTTFCLISCWAIFRVRDKK